MLSNLYKWAKCPFYQSSDNKRIKCEGFNEGTNLCLTFNDKEVMVRHTKIHCRNINGFPNCPLYPVIMKQYEEEEEE